ncbi:MAG: DMT family transporter [Euryarchaeota archaeon]|nr:DMT family transporter [Euryarchaeota archaeon]
MKPDITLLGFAIIVMWGLWGFLYKYGIQKLGLLPALFVTTAVYTVANVIVLVYLARHGVSFPFEGATPLIAMGTIFGVSASLLFMYALQRFPGSTVIPMTALYPAVSAVLAIVILKEQVKAVNALGIILAVIAGYFLTR